MFKIVLASIGMALCFAALAGPVAAAPLRTGTGITMGISASAYRYEEPDLMSLTGPKIGLDFRGTKALHPSAFIRGDLRYATGQVAYNGSGSSNGHADWYVEARGLAGTDWILSNGAISPFFGLGYRYLYNDLRGFTSTGAVGYRRTSSYLYIPLGLNHRIALTGRARLVSEIEYDQLLSGVQVSRLSDTGLGYSDLENKQRGGYGVKLNLMYETNIWAAGPYVNYWNIDNSDTGIVYKNGTPSLIGWEPHNITIELGMKINHQF